MLTLRTLAYNEKAGRDMTTDVGKIDFDPNEYKDKSDAAHAFCAALKKYARENGFDPKGVIMNPDYQDSPLCVCWEEGFYQWGQYMTEYLHNAPHYYTEPYYSFDVCFCDM